MDDNTLIPVQNDSFDEQIYGVKIEHRKRRSKRKKRGKKLLILALLVCALVVIFNNFTSISNFFKSLVSQPGTTLTSTESINNDINSDVATSEGKENSEIIDNSDTIYHFIDTTPDKFTTVYEFDGKIDFKNFDFSLRKKSDLYDIFGENAPIVLIVNFAPLECYSGGEGYSYSSDFSSDSHNVSEIATQICSYLNEEGINTVYLECDSTKETLYENQKQYEKDIKNYLDSNPSIAYIFDISRTLKFNRDMSIDNETVQINGETMPTINFVCGTNNGNLTKEQEKAAYCSNEFSSYFNSTHPLFVSKQTFSRFELNQRFSVPCIRVNIGSYANTFDDALKTARLFSTLLSDFLNS